MITNWKTTIWALALLFSVAGVLVLSSCGDDGDPEPEINAPEDFTYPASTIAVGAEGSVDPSAVAGTDPTFTITSITDQDDITVTADFFSVDATGKIVVAKESTTGLYKVTVTATNSAGSGTGTAEITIGVNSEFDPTGSGYKWQYWINQDAPWTMSGLNGIPGLPIESLEIPTGWPPDWPTGNPDWNDEYLLPYLLLGGVQDLIFQVPSDLACAALTPAESGNTLYFAVAADLSLTTLCEVTEENDGSSALIGYSTISYADEKFHWAITLNNQIPITYVLTDISTTEQFVDPLEPGADGMTPPNVYPALIGTVDQFTTPTNVTDESTILTSLAIKKVEIVLEIIAL